MTNNGHKVIGIEKSITEEQILSELAVMIEDSKHRKKIGALVFGAIAVVGITAMIKPEEIDDIVVSFILAGGVATLFSTDTFAKYFINIADFIREGEIRYRYRKAEQNKDLYAKREALKNQRKLNKLNIPIEEYNAYFKMSKAYISPEGYKNLTELNISPNEFNFMINNYLTSLRYVYLRNISQRRIMEQDKSDIDLMDRNQGNVKLKIR